jgi:hypothetical protein
MFRNCGDAGKGQQQRESSRVTQLEKAVLATLPFDSIVKLVELVVVGIVVIVLFTHS